MVARRIPSVKTVEIEFTLLLGWLSLLLSAADRAEIRLRNEIHQINISIRFDLLLRLLLVSVQFIQNVAVKIVLLITVIILLFLVLAGSLLELVTVHTTSHLLGDFFNLARVVGLNHDTERVNEALLWVVEVRQLNWEIERVD